MPMPSKEATSQGGVGCPGRGSLRPPVSALGVAASRDSREVGVSAERAETAGWIGYADHRQRARFVLAIKGCGLGHVEAACGFDVTKPTPFNGEHKAGPLAMISVPNPTSGLGPLCTDPNFSTVPTSCNP